MRDRAGAGGLENSLLMQTCPTISVITVSFNSRETIADTIESVAAQTHPRIEHIVVDGASTDGTLEVLHRFRGRLSKVVSEPDEGIYAAMNKGLAMATGDVVGTLNSDDVYADENVLGMVAEVFRDDAVDVCYGDIFYVDKGDLNRIVRRWKSEPFRPGLFEQGWMPPHPAFFIRRRVLGRVGPFEASYRFAADFDFMLRALHVQQLRSTYLPRELVKMRVGGETNSSVMNVLKGNIEAYRSCRKYGLGVSPLFIAKKILRKLPQYR
jgi:glycosyltransferase involved in cell wall biosynthesis